MNFQNIPFMTTDWSKIPTTVYPGEIGEASWRTIEVGNVRARMVEYSKNYLADHWCSRGHVLLVLDGELKTELQDGRTFILSKGMTYQVATNAEPHKSSTSTGAKLFIVD